MKKKSCETFCDSVKGGVAASPRPKKHHGRPTGSHLRAFMNDCQFSQLSDGISQSGVIVSLTL